MENQYTVIRKLNLAQILDTLQREKTHSIQGTSKELEKISKGVSNWYEVKIPLNLIKNVILQYHPRCQLSFIPRICTHFFNDLEIVPKHGATVEETCQLLNKLEKEYGIKRSKCLDLIKNYNGKNIGHIILSQLPIGSIPRHKKIQMSNIGLIQIDGFHRLLSLFYPKKINVDFVTCYLASLNKI